MPHNYLRRARRRQLICERADMLRDQYITARRDRDAPRRREVSAELIGLYTGVLFADSDGKMAAYISEQHEIAVSCVLDETTP